MNLKGRWVEATDNKIYEILENPISNDNRELIPCLQVKFNGYHKVKYGNHIKLIPIDRLEIEDENTYKNSIKKAIVAEKEVSNSSEREWYKNLETYCNG